MNARTTPEDTSGIDTTSGADDPTSEPEDAATVAPSIQKAAQAAKAADETPVAEVPPRPDGSSIPAQNEALRSIKRTLVELQNATLEHLRTDGAWSPDESFTDHFSEAFGDLAVAVGGEPSGAAGEAFAADLYDAVSSAIDRVRDAGGGEREVAAAASKVFRTWRSDEAERRVVDAANALAPV